jgi:hypothetical protein
MRSRKKTPRKQSFVFPEVLFLDKIFESLENDWFWRLGRPMLLGSWNWCCALLLGRLPAAGTTAGCYWCCQELLLGLAAAGATVLLPLGFLLAMQQQLLQGLRCWGCKAGSRKKTPRKQSFVFPGVLFLNGMGFFSWKKGGSGGWGCSRHSWLVLVTDDFLGFAANAAGGAAAWGPLAWPCCWGWLLPGLLLLMWGHC